MLKRRLLAKQLYVYGALIPAATAMLSCVMLQVKLLSSSNFKHNSYLKICKLGMRRMFFELVVMTKGKLGLDHNACFMDTHT